MKTVTINLVSSWNHCSQILTGFLSLEEKGIISVSIKKNKLIEEQTGNLAAVIVDYDGIRIVYDVMDGYQNPQGMKYLLDNSDYYFKRSFSSKLNNELFDKEYNNKIHRLGMNYLVSCANNPYNSMSLRSVLFALRGDKPNSYFINERFETTPVKKHGNFKILFLTRLWDHSIDNAEKLNEQRINIIRMLKKKYRDKFIGGIRLSELAKELAPDLVVSKQFTERANYLKLLREADVCIGTLGLHQSTGWKTAEYVASSKAIVNEELFYEVPGSFSNGINYLSFSDEQECCNHVERLLADPEYLFNMKVENNKYYKNWLRPDVLIQNTLNIVDNNSPTSV